MSKILVIGDIIFHVYKDGSIFRRCKNGRTYKLTPRIGKRGYKYLLLRTQDRRIGMYVHRILAMAFLQNPENLPIVRHKDGNKLNNNLTNLAWSTQKENMSDRKLHGTDNSGERCGNSKLTWKIVRAIKELFNRDCPVTTTRLAEWFGVAQPTVSDIKRGVTWQES